MKPVMAIVWRYRKLRAWYRRTRRLLFPSPAEVEAARLLGCRVWVFPIFCDTRTKYPLAIIRAGGWYKASYLEREVYVRGNRRSAYIDFGNRRLKLGIEIDGRMDAAGRPIHNVIDDDARDKWLLHECGWQLLRIPAGMVSRNSSQYRPRLFIDKVKRWLD